MRFLNSLRLGACKETIAATQKLRLHASWKPSLPYLFFLSIVCFFYPRSTQGLCQKPVVSYAFLTENDLPLWPVWEKYFAGCRNGSYTIVVHAQKPRLRYGMLRAMREVGGGIVPPAKTIKSQLRFSFNMVNDQDHVIPPPITGVSMNHM